MPQQRPPDLDANGNPIDDARPPDLDANGNPIASSGRTWTDTALDALPTIGGAVGGIVGGIGGTVGGFGVGGVPGAVGGAALGGAGGESARQLLSRVLGRGGPSSSWDAAGDIGTQAAIQGASELVGQGAAGVLRTVGRGFYRAGALPLMNIRKYGDLITEGIANRVPVSKGGIAKAGRLLSSRQAEKAAAVTAADGRATFRTQGVVDDALQKAKGYATEQRLAGLGDPSAAFQARAGRIVSENGPGLSPSQLESVKGTIDDVSGGAFKKMRMREPVSPTERMNVSLTQAMGDAQQSVMPNYRDMNQGINNAFGLRKMIERRIGPSGAHHGLENAMTAVLGPKAIPGRLLLAPGVTSRIGIGAHMAGEAPSVYTNAMRLAILQQLMSSHDPQQ